MRNFVSGKVHTLLVYLWECHIVVFSVKLVNERGEISNDAQQRHLRGETFIVLA